MVDEQRDININVRAAQAIRTLTSMATRLGEMNTLVGSSDRQLRTAEATLQTYSVRITTAAKTITLLRNTQTELAASLAAANRQLLAQQAALSAAEGKLNGARAVIGRYRTELTLANRTIASQSRELTALTGTMERYAVASGRAATGSAAMAGGIRAASLTTQSLRNTMTSASYSLGLFGGVLLLLEALPAKVAFNFSSEFAQVQRTVQGAGEDTKKSLIQLSEQIPVTFKDLAGIATLGGQLGLSKDQIVDFTRVVSELTATTDLTTDAAGTLIGRMAQFYNLPSSQFEALASAILRVGVTSVATESQIATIATRLSGAGETLHLSAQEVIGFSAALASVAVRPYAAAGTFNRFAGVIRNAVAGGGAELKTLAKVAGVTSDEFSKAFNSNKAGQFDKVFTKLIEGFTNTKRTGGDAVNVLRELGLTGVTDAQTFRQLAAAPGAVTKAFNEANTAFAKGTELQRQYGIISGTNASKIRIMANSFEALMNAFGQAGANSLGALAPKLTELFSTLNDIASNPVSGAILGAGGIVAALTALAAIAGAVGLRGYAGLLGVTDAMRGLREESGVAGGAMAAFRTELALTGPAGAVAAKGLGIASTAARGLAAAFGPLLFIGTVAELVGELSINTSHAVPSMHSLAKSIDQVNSQGKADSFISKLLSGDFSNQTNAAKQYLGAQATGGILKQISDVEAALSNNTIINGLSNISTLGTSNLFGAQQSGSTAKQVTELDDALSKLVAGGNDKKASEIIKSLQSFASDGTVAVSYKQILSLLPQTSAALKEQAAQARVVDTTNASLAKGNLDVAKTLRTLLNLGNKSKFLGQFEDSFAKAVQPLTDFNSVVSTVQQHLQDVDAAKKASQPLNEYLADQNRDVAVSLQQVTDQLNTNNGAQQTWLSNLTQLSQQISQDPAFGPGTATQIASTLLAAGYSVTNASFLQQLVNATPDQRDAWINAQQTAMNLAGKAAADTLLSSGYLMTANGTAIGKDTADGMAKALAAGFDVQQVMQLFNLQFTQNPLEVTADTGPAKGTINEFVNQITGFSPNLTLRANTSPALAAVAATIAAINKMNATIRVNSSVGRLATIIAPTGKTGGQVGGLPYTRIPGYANGSYNGLLKGPGTPTSDSMIARVSTEEYITRAKAVKYYGLPFFNAVNSLKFPKYAAGTGGAGYGPGNPGPGGPQVTVNVTQNYPTTRDPIKKLKQDAESVLAGIWT